MARTITQRETALLTEFGFKLAKAGGFETVLYDEIVAILPTEEGMEIHYNSRFPLEKAVVRVMNIDIPDGKLMSGGERKDLDTAWIFVYYDEMIETKRDGTTTVR